jgi:hypothetical protein
LIERKKRCFLTQKEREKKGDRLTQYKWCKVRMEREMERDCREREREKEREREGEKERESEILSHFRQVHENST